MMMSRSTLPMLILLAALATLLLTFMSSPSDWSTASAPNLERIREALELSVIEADVSTIVTSRLAGYTGGVRCILIVQGTARIGVDLDGAVLDQVDQDERQLVVHLPQPTVLGVDVDHQASQLYSVDRGGLWAVLPFATREGDVIAEAWSHAERVLHEDAAQRPQLIRRAQDRTEAVLRASADALGWSVTVVWQPCAPSAKVASLGLVARSNAGWNETPPIYAGDERPCLGHGAGYLSFSWAGDVTDPDYTRL